MVQAGGFQPCLAGELSCGSRFADRPVPRSSRAVTARPAAMLRAAFTSALHDPASQATHWKSAWLLRFSGATCPQREHRCDVYAAGTISTRPKALCCSRATSNPHPLAADLTVEAPFLRDAGARAFRSAACRASHCAHLQVLDLDGVEAARQIGGGFFPHPPPHFSPLDPLSPPWSRLVSPARRPGARSSSPLDRAAETATPRSTPTTLPSPGPAIGSGMAAKAMCQRPERSKVTR